MNHQPWDLFIWHISLNVAAAAISSEPYAIPSAASDPCPSSLSRPASQSYFIMNISQNVYTIHSSTWRISHITYGCSNLAFGCSFSFIGFICRTVAPQPAGRLCAIVIISRCVHAVRTERNQHETRSKRHQVCCGKTHHAYHISNLATFLLLRPVADRLFLGMWTSSLNKPSESLIWWDGDGCSFSFDMASPGYRSCP